jgi:hypothetical protein
VNKTIISIGILASCVAAWALVTAYHVEPRTAAMSGWTRLPPHPSYYVSEVTTVSFDLPITASLFCGASGAGGVA